MSVKKMMGKVVKKTNLAGNTWMVEVELEEVAEFTPGQYVSLKVNDEGQRRSYSIAGLPGKKVIELVVDVSPMGVGSRFFLGLNIGDTVELLGYMGKFTVGEEAKNGKELLFVGTGAGVVPLKVMIEDLLINKRYQGRVVLVWGMRFERDLYRLKEIEQLQSEFDNFHFEIVLSQSGENWQGEKGHVGDYIKKMNGEWKETSAFLCGNPVMIIEMTEMLTEKGVEKKQIYYERYA